jgi:hypothetical protein
MSAGTPAPSVRKTRDGGNRRTPAVLDPIDAARQGEEALRQRLAALSLEQLKDVVADYGMDPGKLVMKWKTPQRGSSSSRSRGQSRGMYSSSEVRGTVFFRPERASRSKTCPRKNSRLAPRSA